MIPNITTCQNILNVKNHDFYKLKSLEFIIEDIIGLANTSINYVINQTRFDAKPVPQRRGKPTWPLNEVS